MSISTARRRVLRPGALLVAGLALLVGCGSTTAPDSGDSRVVSAPRGEVRVPAAPQRIVSLNVLETTALLELGVTPVGTPTAEPATLPERFRDAYAKIASVGDGVQTNLEAVGRLQPDLIVGPYNERDGNRDEYARLAPAVLGPFKVDVWRERVALVADAVNRAAAARRLSDAYDQRHKQFAEEHADVLGRLTVDVVQGFGNGQWAAHNVGSSAGTVALRDAGVRFGKLSSIAERKFPTYSQEQLEQLAGSNVILYTTNRDGSPLEATQELIDLDVFKRLSAARTGNVIPFRNFVIGSYLSAEEQLAELAGILGKVTI